ncbi:hypothetical protein BGW80DRAFT_1229586 [Lactifluus volemus]|nr:hypothetical protein BGW80DRAFT_1229586 [Lactifluus volemus]
MQQDRFATLVALLDIATTPQRGETAVVDFTVELFKVLGYTHRERVARTRAETQLFVCGETICTKPDICLFDRSRKDFLLVVQEDKSLENMESGNAPAQLVAEAVAAFNGNNSQRDAFGLPPLAEKVSHAWHRHGRIVARFLQDSCHRDSVDSYSPWDLSPRGNPGDVLLPTNCPSP